MVVVVDIVSRHSLSIDGCHRNQPEIKTLIEQSMCNWYI